MTAVTASSINRWRGKPPASFHSYRGVRSGVLRDEIAPWDRSNGRRKALFGTGGGDDDDGGAQGALTVGDARLLCLPVRSLAGVFAWVTCPLVLSRFLREARWLGIALSPELLSSAIPTPAKNHHLLVGGSALMVGNDCRTYLGPLKAHPFQGRAQPLTSAWAHALAKLVNRWELDGEADRATWEQTYITPLWNGLPSPATRYSLTCAEPRWN